MALTAERGRWPRRRTDADRSTSGPDRGPGRGSGPKPGGGSAPDGGPSASRSLGVPRRVVLIPVAMALLLGVVVCLYGSSVTSVRPRGLPVLVAGSAESAKAFADQIERASPGAMDVRAVPDVAAADRALRDREAYAAFVLAADGLSLRLASAASPAVAEALVRGMAITYPDLRVPVVDVVPNAPADHQGGGLSAGYLPLVLLAAATGALLARLVRFRQERLVGLLAFMVAAGVAGTVALCGGLDVLPDHLVRSVIVLSVVVVAVVAPVVGLAAVAGTRGLVAAVAVTVLGAAVSAASSAPEMLPTPWGGLGQLLPPGAGVTLARSTLYFDGAGGGRAAAVLAIWAVAGIVLLLIGGDREDGAEDAPESPSATLPADEEGDESAAGAERPPRVGRIVRPREGGAEISPGVSPREEGFRA